MYSELSSNTWFIEGLHPHAELDETITARLIFAVDEAFIKVFVASRFTLKNSLVCLGWITPAVWKRYASLEFCRNCLTKWYREVAQKKGIEISDPDARKHVYGMSYDEWKKKYQK